jgi:hypothetical protein
MGDAGAGCWDFSLSHIVICYFLLLLQNVGDSGAGFAIRDTSFSKQQMYRRRGLCVKTFSGGPVDTPWMVRLDLMTVSLIYFL